ncbi:hypothetical protein Lal_00017008 [Lupinus albus]|nr:hypothetical protein Lal_00017008 [Lupinus albus]
MGIRTQRRVELQHNEYPEFLETLDRLKLGAIASPHDKFDLEVVREFYANAYPPEEVRRFSSTNHVDGHPDGYHLMMEKTRTMTHGFNNDEIAELLCIPGRTHSTNIDGRPKRIYRKDMTTLAQIWMIFCLHNVIPNSHVSSLPLSDCYLLYCILAGVEIDIARLMATEIYKTSVKGGNKGTMGFPSFITSLCARQGVQVTPKKPIKKHITKQYIKQNCKEDNVEPHGQQPPQEPQHIAATGQMSQQQSFYAMSQHHYPNNQFWLSPKEFTASFPWPGVKPAFPGEAGAGEPSGSGATEDEETYDEELP